MKQQETAKQTLNTIIKQTGLKDQLKKHLRLKLAQRLHNPSEVVHVNIDVFKHRMIVSAVKQYLDRIGCIYSSSIFCSESGYEQKLLERVELKELLSINSIDESQSIVQHLFNRVAHGDPFRKHSQSQTDPEEGHISMEQKFAIIDLEFRKVLQQTNQLKPTASKHVCSQQKQWYEKELHRFKEFESHKIKTKVGEEWRLKFQAYAEEMQGYYQRKLDKIRQKERMLVEDFTRKQKTYGEKIQGWESSAKSRTELIQMKEATVMREKLNLQLQRKKALEQIKKSISESKDKTREYENLILNMQKRIAYEVGLSKLSAQQQQAKKEEEFKSKRKFVDEEYDKLMRIKDTMEFVTKENDRLLKENQALRKENQAVRAEIRDLKQEYKNKEERLDSLKEEFYSLQNEKQQLDRALETEAKLRKKREEELAKTRKQLDKLREKEAMESQSSFDERVAPKDLTKDMGLKIAKMREQRKKEIERFKLQL